VDDHLQQPADQYVCSLNDSFARGRCFAIRTLFANSNITAEEEYMTAMNDYDLIVIGPGEHGESDHYKENEHGRVHC
jgi:hypothetical protein